MARTRQDRERRQAALAALPQDEQVAYWQTRVDKAKAEYERAAHGLLLAVNPTEDELERATAAITEANDWGPADVAGLTFQWDEALAEDVLYERGE